MDRRWLMLLGAFMLSGCGESKAPPAPAPAFQPSATATTPPAETPRQQAAEESLPATDEQNIAEEMPAEEKEKLAIDAPAEEQTEASPTNDKPQPAVKDEAPNETAAANDDAAAVESEKPQKKSGGKLFRGLGNSLTRALAKLPSANSPVEEDREPPALKDDPFPEGEPSEKKANE